jgi:demethylmenaquinone methyltransferase/2-methoxy-6-polyprenyl-1,4-benzoquinol methylase
MLDHFDILAPLYDRLMGAPDAERLALHLRPTSRGCLLDLGGGTGRVSNRLRGRFDRAVVCDPSGRMLAKARRKGLDGIRGRAEALPFSDAAFDRVLVVDALHHFADPPSAMGEIARVLRPGGRVVIEEFDADRAVVRMAALAEKMAWMKSRFFRPRDIRRIMQMCGLEADIADRHRFSVWVVGDKP